MRKYGKYEKMPDGTRAKQPAAKKFLLQTYLTSLLCMVLCVAMFFGTTYAWFTSEVTNKANEIYVGTLDVGLYKMKDGSPVSLVSSESEEKLFDGNIRWEPGYTAMETIKITNGEDGDLSFRYALTFKNGMINGQSVEDNEEAKALLRKVAENFVVYVHPGDYAQGEEAPQSFADIKKIAEDDTLEETEKAWRLVRMGKDPATLADILEKGFPVLSGNMENLDAEDTYIIALHMLETAGEGADEEESIRLSEELMGQQISLNVKLTAYQRTHEQDAFGAGYDLQAHVTELGELPITYREFSSWQQDYFEETILDTAYQFQPVESAEEVKSSPYKKFIADFVVWADKKVEANSMALAGYYDLWCSMIDDHWIALQADFDVQPEEEIHLVKGLWPVSYKDLCDYGNDGIGFLCGAKDLTGENAGTTITVELRLYEVDANDDETGNYIVAGRYDYTFPEKSTAP